MHTDLEVIADFLDKMQTLARGHDPEVERAPPDADATINWLRLQLDNWRIDYGKMVGAYKAGGGPADGMHDALRDPWRNRGQ